MSEIPKKLGIQPEIIVKGSSYYLPVDVLVLKEMVDGQSREIAYIQETWPSLKEEESVKVVFTDVEIPCSVVVEDE